LVEDISVDDLDEDNGVNQDVDGRYDVVGTQSDGGVAISEGVERGVSRSDGRARVKEGESVMGRMPVPIRTRPGILVGNANWRLN
jgi:hypothetical protein